MACSIELLSRDNAHQWDDFNVRAPNGTIFHTLKWKQVLEEIFHLKLQYYLIRSEGEVVGISPWLERSALNFRGLVSIPHAEENGIVLDENTAGDHFGEIVSLFARNYSFLHFNMGNSIPLNGIGFAHEAHNDTGYMVADLRETPPEAIWAGFSKNTRFSIRAFENDGFTIRVIDRPDALDDFYRYYTQNLTHIRGEILPLTFFQRLLELFPDQVRVTVLTRDDIFAGGSLALIDPARRKFYGTYLAINRNLPNRYTPSYQIMWESINWAWENGYEQLFFGRQRVDPKNPRFHNKSRFGARHLPIHSHLVLLSKPMLISYKIRNRLLGNRDAQVSL